MWFVATEVGFEDGMGGASNAESVEAYHYLAFGLQEDEQHPENSGIYFEFDGQGNGGIDLVKKVVVGELTLGFELRDGRTITVGGQRCEASWEGWIAGVREVFGGLVEDSKGQ